MTIRLTTRGIRTAEAIRDRVPFTTSGSLKGETRNYIGGRWLDHGMLNLTEREALDATSGIDYVVWSYHTPIAWHTVDGWHVVDQRFSLTTTKHQGNLYLVNCTCTTKHLTAARSSEIGETNPNCPVHFDVAKAL